MTRAFTPDCESFRELASGVALVPICAEQLGDLLTPVSAALRIFGHVRRPFLLESAEGGENIGRYSYLGGDPFLELVGDANGITLHTPSAAPTDRKSTRLNSSHVVISYAVFCLKKKTTKNNKIMVQH